MTNKLLAAMLMISGITNLALGITSSIKNREEKLDNERNLIVACIEKNENEQEIVKLHKATVYKKINDQILSNGQVYIDYDCNTDDEVTNKYRAYENGLPDSSEYDELCEECFKGQN